MQPNQMKNQTNCPRPVSSGAALILFVFLFFGLSLVVSRLTDQMPQLKTDYAFNMVSVILTQLVCILPPVLLVCHKQNFDFLTVMRLRKGIDLWQILLLIVVAGGFLFFGNSLNNMLVDTLEQYAGYTPYVSKFTVQTVPQLIFSTFVYGVLPAFCEEFFFRGLVLSSFRTKSRALVIVFSALLFGLMHGNVQQLLFAFLAGCLFATVVEITDSLLPSMLLHFLNNAVAMVINYFQQDQPVEKLPFELKCVSGLTIAILGGVIMLGGLAGYIYYTRNKNKTKYGQTMPNSVTATDAEPQKSPWATALILIFIAVQCGYLAMDLLL